MCFDFLCAFFSETFLILRRTERDMIKNVYFLHAKYPLFLFILMRPEFCRQILEKYSNVKFNENPSKGRFTHIMSCPCRPHDVPLPCRAAKGLECVFPI